MTLAIIDTDKLLTTAQAAKLLRMPVQTVQQYCRFFHLGETPAIECLKFGRAYMVHKDALKRFKETPRKRGRPPEEGE